MSNPMPNTNDVMMIDRCTPWPWRATKYGVIVGGPEREFTNGSNAAQIACVLTRSESDDPESERDATAALMADALAMNMALALICAGVARIDRSECGRITDFCFDGMRYSLSALRTWTDTIGLVGWSKCQQALAAARGGA